MDCVCHVFHVPFSVVWAVLMLHVLFLGDLVACPDALTLHELTCLISHFIWGFLWVVLRPCHLVNITCPLRLGRMSKLLKDIMNCDFTPNLI